MTLKINRVVTQPSKTKARINHWTTTTEKVDPLKHVTKQELSAQLDKLKTEYDLLKSLYDSLVQATINASKQTPYYSPWQLYGSTINNISDVAGTSMPSDPQFTHYGLSNFSSNYSAMASGQMDTRLGNNSVPADAMPISDLTPSACTEPSCCNGQFQTSDGNIQPPV